MEVLLVDGDSIFGEVVRLILAKLGADVEIIEAKCFQDALYRVLKNPDLDLALMDIGLPDIRDVDALKIIQSKLPSTPVVILPSNNDCRKIEQMLKLGAKGYIPKSTNAKLLKRSLKLVLSGGTYIPQKFFREILPVPTTR